MVELGMSKISTKGQVVIPNYMRKNFPKGEKVVFIEENGVIIMKNMKDFSKRFQKDFSRAQRIDKIVEDYEQGKLKTINFKDVNSAIEYLDNLDKKSGGNL